MGAGRFWLPAVGCMYFNCLCDLCDLSLCADTELAAGAAAGAPVRLFRGRQCTTPAPRREHARSAQRVKPPYKRGLKSNAVQHDAVTESASSKDFPACAGIQAA